MTVRMPSASEYALAVEKEHRWLPVLAPRLPLAIPAPLAQGGPGAGYPLSWSVYAWLDGEPASPDSIADPVRFALDLAGFLSALQGIDTIGSPRPGRHNWYRGGPLRTYDGEARRALTALDGHLDTGLAAEIWTTALDAPWDGTQTWFHGDVAQGNLLLRDGNLAAVIDFGTCGVGDPACDLAIAGTLLTVDGRRTGGSGRRPAPGRTTGPERPPARCRSRRRYAPGMRAAPRTPPAATSSARAAVPARAGPRR
jgi:aminoglycoside phosphotransferase (APT) family kinase protein